MKIQKCTFALFLLFPLMVSAQRLFSVQSKYVSATDKSQSWNFYLRDTVDKQVLVFEGDLEPTFVGYLEPTTWDYRIGEVTGRIRKRWKDDPNSEWELRSDNRLVTAAPIYLNEPRQWRILDGKKSIELHCKYNNLANEWIAETEANGTFFLYATQENNPTDWTIVDDTIDLSLQCRMMLMFIVLHTNIPRH